MNATTRPTADLQATIEALEGIIRSLSQFSVINHQRPSFDKLIAEACAAAKQSREVATILRILSRAGSVEGDNTLGADLESNLNARLIELRAP